MNVEFTAKDRVDLIEIWIDNAERYNVEHADKYRTFLLTEIGQLADYPARGKLVDSLPNLRYLVIKRRASGHGHAAYYEVLTAAIRIVRILHTAMYAPDHIDEV